MKIIGHRGARNEAPENTLAGFAYLRSLGINHVELDVHLDAEQQLVVIHDDTVDRTTDHEGNVRDYTTIQLADMDAHQLWHDWSPPKHATYDLTINRGVPTLKHVLADWPNLASVQLEVKPASDKDLEIIARDLIELCQTLNLGDRGIITSSSLKFHQYLNELDCKQPTGLVADETITDPIQTAKSLNCNYLCLDWQLCKDSIVQAAKDANLKLSLWTVNDTEQLQTLENWKIDGLITDVPTQWLELTKPV